MTHYLTKEILKQRQRIVKELTAKGITIVMVSHDVEFCGKYADRCALFFDGKIISENTPRCFFSGNSFYTTAANRMSRHIFKNAITVNDIVELVKQNYGIQKSNDNNCRPIKEQHNNITQKNPHYHENKKIKKSRNQIVIEISMFLLALLTIYIGLFAFEKRHYILTNLLLIIYAMIPFFYQFENRKPKAQEIVMLSILVAIATIARAAFFMIPNFKPTLAIVIIAGVCLGKESGFLTGAMTAFVSNFLFGQGPWTPYQMIATAIIGYLAGVFFYQRRINIWILSLFGGIATFFIYGCIVDLWTILLNPEPTFASAMLVYSAATYFNAIHAAATIIFLLFLAKPMLEKLNRVKIKYGLEDK